MSQKDDDDTYELDLKSNNEIVLRREEYDLLHVLMIDITYKLYDVAYRNQSAYDCPFTFVATTIRHFIG